MTTRSDAKYQPAYQYRCGNGHHLAADQPITTCPIAHCTQPDLHRHGTGSRTPQEHTS